MPADPGGSVSDARWRTGRAVRAARDGAQRHLPAVPLVPRGDSAAGAAAPCVERSDGCVGPGRRAGGPAAPPVDGEPAEARADPLRTRPWLRAHGSVAGLHEG